MAADRVPVAIVGIDSSPESDAALDWVRAVCPGDTRIVAVHAWELPLITGYDVVIPIDPAEIEQLAADGLNERIAREDDDRLEPMVRQGHSGRALVKAAEELEADVIVVGHRGRGRMSMMLGSTANYVVHHSDRPVVVIRGDHIGPPERVVVGVDDHDIDEEHPENESVRALRWAYALAGVQEVRVVHAWFLPALAAGMFTPMAADFERMDAAARKVVDHVVAAAGPPPEGVKVTCDAIRGTGGFGLIEESRHADLVVIGSRGRGGFTEVILGSTSAEVAANSHSPVVIVR
jgi:nucleotide-binding universal stress UspA family protein